MNLLFLRKEKITFTSCGCSRSQQTKILNANLHLLVLCVMAFPFGFWTKIYKCELPSQRLVCGGDNKKLDEKSPAV